MSVLSVLVAVADGLRVRGRARVSGVRGADGVVRVVVAVGTGPALPNNEFPICFQTFLETSSLENQRHLVNHVICFSAIFDFQCCL